MIDIYQLIDLEESLKTMDYPDLGQLNSAALNLNMVLMVDWLLLSHDDILKSKAVACTA